jgi:hypothetical protein
LYSCVTAVIALPQHQLQEEEEEEEAAAQNTQSSLPAAAK